MIAEDRQEKERVDARNALEEYVYDLRSKLSEEDQLATFIAEADKEALCRTLDDTEIWLYEEGEDCTRQVYSERLMRLKVRCSMTFGEFDWTHQREPHWCIQSIHI